MKKIICILLCISVFSLLTGCNMDKKSFSKLYQGNLSKITTIEITTGKDGKNTVITDPQAIKNFFTDIKDIKVTRNKNTDVKGWKYSVTFYNQDKKLMSFTTNEIEGKTKKDNETLITAIETLLNQK